MTSAKGAAGTEDNHIANSMFSLRGHIEPRTGKHRKRDALALEDAFNTLRREGWGLGYLAMKSSYFENQGSNRSNLLKAHQRKIYLDRVRSSGGEAKARRILARI